MKTPPAPPQWVSQLGGLPADAFFEKVIAEGFGLTFPDVKVTSSFSAISATDGDVTTRFSRNIPLLVPISGAAMDTVTESAMAIALALEGGIGVIHKNLSPDDQAREVAKVKHFVHGLIRTPVTFGPDETVSNVLATCAGKSYRFRTFPIVSSGGTLLGLVTSQDFGFDQETATRMSEIMTKDVVTVPAGTKPEDALRKMVAEKKKVLPVVNENHLLVGLYLRSDLERVVRRNTRANLDSNGQLFVAAATRTGLAGMERNRKLVEAGVNALVVDTAHGDTRDMFETISLLRQEFGDEIDIVAGNVSEPESAWRLASAGVDAIKVGQGPGSICTTRKVAGIGNPQVTAVYACARAIREFPEVCVIADGGITASGDITVALATGAHSVMVGRALAGCDEAPGDVQEIGGVRFRYYRGMGSLAALRANAESRARYGQTGSGKFVAEGVEARIPVTGPVADEIAKLVGGLKAGLGYIGAQNLDELRKLARFRRLTPGAVQESNPHSLAQVIG
jgi:IMP dehydrogenase